MDLKQVSQNLRATANLLTEQADEIDRILKTLEPLQSLLGGLQQLGGGTPKGRPLSQPSTPAARPPKTVLSSEQKQQMRDHYQSLPEKDKTLENRRKLAAAYGVTPVQYNCIVNNTMSHAQSVAKLAATKREQNQATRN